MTIRQELEMMGPERVRAGMVAFAHREGRDYADSLCGGCCFLGHAYERGLWEGAQALTGKAYGVSVTEAAFENWTHARTNPAGHGRADLHAECVQFLAEHGVAVEPAGRLSPEPQEVSP